MRCSVRGLRPRDGIGDELGDIDCRIDDAIDERRVGAVFEQAAHEVGEQRFVRPDRCIDAAGAVELARSDDLVVHALAHPVQALEFVVGGAGQRVDRSDRERVVARELGIDRVGCRQHRFGTGEIRHIGVHLAREHGVVAEPLDLRALDLAIPVRALDQSQSITARARF